MKQQIIEIKKKLLLVELNGSISTNNLPNKSLITWHDEKGFMHTHLFDLNIELIGKLTDITESQFAEWVEVKRVSFDKIWYPDYQNKAKWLYAKSTAKESFFSKLKADGILFTNKLGEFPTKHNTGLEYGMQYLSKVASWEEEQEKVFDINRCWIFEII